MATGGLTRWFKEQWVDISRPKKGGGFEPCGRKDADEGKYPKCVPASRAAKMTEAEIKSAVRRKRRAESTERREGKKPINVKTKVEKKNVPTNPKLYAEVKAAAKRKFDVYPSAYANGWLVQEYKRRGGKYKTVAKGQVGLTKHAEHDQKTHGRRKSALPGVDWDKFNTPADELRRLRARRWPGDILDTEEDGVDIEASIDEVVEHYELIVGGGHENSDGDTVARTPGGDYIALHSEGGKVSVSKTYRYFDEVADDVDLTEMAKEIHRDWQRQAAKEVAYHGTSAENLESIRRDGLETRRVTRGLSNRGVGNAIYMHPEPYFVGSYADAGLGSTIEIDIPRLIEDGLLKVGQLGREVGFSEGEAVEALASDFEDYEYTSGVGEIDGADPQTIVIFEDIPPKYLSVNGEPLSKHAEHDQKTHGRRKTATGLSAVREAARGTRLARHRYGEIEGQTSFFTDEPYAKPKQAEYTTGIGTVKDNTPVPPAPAHILDTTDEEDRQIAKAIFDMDIELLNGDLVEVRVSDVMTGFGNLTVEGRVTVDGEFAGNFRRTLNFERAYAYNSSFEIEPDYQGQGLGTTILRHWEDQYHQAGLLTMRVTAASQGDRANGAYTWLKYGYQPDDSNGLIYAYALSLAGEYEAGYKDADEFIGQLAPVLDSVSMNDSEPERVFAAIRGGNPDPYKLAESIKNIVYGGFYADPLALVADSDEFARYLKESDINWEGQKDTQPLFYTPYAKSDEGSRAAREVINRWMTEDPAGLENDDPQFWSDIRAAFKKVKKDSPTVNSVHVASVMGSKKKRKKRGISGMVEVDKGDYPGHPFRGNQWVGGIPEGGGKGKAPSYEKGKGKVGGKKTKEEAPKRKVASFDEMKKLVPKSEGNLGSGPGGTAQSIKKETSRAIADAITAAGIADTPEKAHQIALELQDLVQQNQVIFPIPAFKAGRAISWDGPQDHINAETLASGVLRAWADSSSNRYSMVLQLAALHELGVVSDLEGVDFHNDEMAFTDDRDIWLDGRVDGRDSVIPYDEMRERFPNAMGFVGAVVKAQYEATQQKFKEAGVTHVTVSRGIGVQFAKDFRDNLGVDEASSKSLEQTVGILGNIDERPLSSWTADTGTAIEFATDYTESNTTRTVLTAVVPVELLFSTPYTGLGSPIESEVVVLSGNYKSVAFMQEERYDDWATSARDIEGMVNFAVRSGDIGKADRPKKSIGAMLNEGNNADWIKALAKRKRKKMSKKEPIKDPKGGLTAAGRRYFKRKEGANLKPGVKGKADTPEKMRRKGSFLTRFYTNPSGPLQNDKGEPTRLALAAAAWGEPVPKNRSDAAKLAAKGRRLLERYENVKKHADHDQKTHGRRKTATGGGIKPKMRRITETAGKRAKQLAAMARDGGFTFNPKRSEMRSKGVAVAVGKENERKVRVEEFSEDSIRQYAQDHAELLAKPRHHLGAWRETEKGVDYVYLDVSVVMPSLESAADLGRANDQIGIFDLSTFTTHYRAPDKEGNLKYIPLNLTDATGYDRTAATDMATNVGKADGDKGVMFVPGEMLDESSLPKIVERIMALKPVGKGEKESRKNP